ncbi:hypothetical protein EYD00_18935 [Agrobacterium sp. 33MFTa1.1]|uniref:hypothetical protein n=1 Tax=Agrobacterium sp. 33MFTa1.1 TaxID=1279031 RepID=UPI0005581CE9|nr:hypothetical protein [Agrobacterium sp. 33MFTa1.1]QBJ15517.1 hypothetical protein EYD00_18935 [Agrobacterium sp. 33MFTa1.1]
MTKTPKSPEQLRVDSLIETIQQHPTDVLEAERRLYSRKWFDYRFMSPHDANMLFARTYQEIFRRKFAAEVDSQSVENVSGIHLRTIATNARERSHLVAARQRADDFGVPYPFYIEVALEFALRRGDKRDKFPRPNQLHGNDKSAPWFAKFLMGRWREYVTAGLARVEHPSYRIENYRGIPAQDDFRRFILEYVKEVSMPLHRAIQLFSYDRKQVPAEIFKSITTEEAFERALAIADSNLSDGPVAEMGSTSLGSTERWPTCFGMHYTHDPSSKECSSCPQRQGCKKLGDFVLSEASRQCGVEDPAGDYKRRMDRKRQQRCRAKKRGREDGSGSITLPHIHD